jgi:fumarate reductase subunit C
MMRCMRGSDGCVSQLEFAVNPIVLGLVVVLLVLMLASLVYFDQKAKALLAEQRDTSDEAALLMLAGVAAATGDCDTSAS